MKTFKEDGQQTFSSEELNAIADHPIIFHKIIEILNNLTLQQEKMQLAIDALWRRATMHV